MMKKLVLILRSTVANIYFYPAMAIGMLVAIFIGLVSRKKMIYVWDNYFNPWIFGLMLKLVGIKIVIKGQEYNTKGVIFASKHESAFETYAFTKIIKNSVFILKKELLYIPIFGWGQALYGMIPIDRSGGARIMKKMLIEAKDRVKNGRSIILFPEGTRCKHGQVKGYKSGIVFLADGLDMPIVPVALNSDLCWAKSSFIRKPGTVTFEFMPPIRTSDYKSKKEFMSALETIIEDKCKEIA